MAWLIDTKARVPGREARVEVASARTQGENSRISLIGLKIALEGWRTCLVGPSVPQRGYGFSNTGAAASINDRWDDDVCAFLGLAY